MIRKIINIDREKCNGCGLCVNACHEGAIGIVDNKACLLRDDYCDGLGDCLPACPMGAITFVRREAAAYDEAAVMANKKSKQNTGCSCPGSAAKVLKNSGSVESATNRNLPSRLSQWPVQIRLVPENAPYFDNADILIAADCTAYAYASFHEDFINGRITLIGCPKLDRQDYSKKLCNIFKNNNVKSVTVARMEVPCCGGIENAVRTAVIDSKKTIELSVKVISRNGKIINE